jgi:DNA-binding CsgD family transcriptional regulator
MSGSMDQVSWRAVDAAVKLARLGGVQDTRALAGIPFAIDALPEMRWVPWDHYCIILENIEAACGGPAQLDELTQNRYCHLLPEAAPYVRAFVSPDSLYRGVLRFMRPMFPNQRISYESASDGTVRYSARMVSNARGCAAFYRGSIAGMRGLSQLLDMPMATVERATWDAYSLDCVLRLPSSGTVLSQARRTSLAAMRTVASLFDEIGGELRHYIHALSSTHDVVRQQSQRMVLLNRVGQRLSQQTDVDSLADVLLESLHQHTTCNYVALWRSPVAGGSPTLVRESGARPEDGLVRVVPLIAGGQDVGRLEVAAGEGPLDTSFVLDLAPWIAIAVENARTFEALARARADDERPALERRVQDAVARWTLTPRQRDVLRCLAQGFSNKETAAALDCAENTVELHVTQLLKKAETVSRAQIIARFWST